MAEALTSEPIPVEQSSDGVMRVRGTRVTLDTIWVAFGEGATAEEIVQEYPSISLADAYQVIGCCLRHSAQLSDYLEERSKSVRAIKEANESKWQPDGIRGRLLERRLQK